MRQKIHVGGFLKEGNKFLFGKRRAAKSWAPGLWDIVGGKALKNEHPLYALRRETMEEICVEVVNAVLLTTMEITGPKENDSFSYMIYMITGYNGSPFNCSTEHSAIRWFTRSELDQYALALPEYTHMIDEWINSQNGNEKIS